MRRLARIAFLLASVALALLGPRPILAQFPIPGLESPIDGPELRLAGEDPLEDRLEALVGRIDRRLAVRTPEAERVNASLDRRREADGGVSPMLERLAAVHAREIRKLEEARELATEGLSKLAVHIPEKIAAGFDALVEAAAELKRLRRLAEEREARARRLLASGGVTEARTATTGFGARLRAERAQLEAAEAVYAMAEALHTRAENRLAEQRVKAMRAGLVVRPGEVGEARARLAAARADYEAAEDALERRRVRLADELFAEPEEPLGELRREAAEAALAEAVRAAASAKARQTQASIELTALTALSTGSTPTFGPEHGPDALAAELAAVAEARLEAEAKLSEARARLRAEPPRGKARLLTRIQDRLEDVLASLAEERAALAAALELERLLGLELLTRRGKTPEEWARALSLTAAVLAIAWLLLTKGLSALHEVEAKVGRGRLTTLLLLLYPVVVVVATISILAWPVWEVPFGWKEALGAIDRPLFYVDEQPISVVSLLKLVLTVWLSVALSRGIRSFLEHRVYRRLSVDVGFGTTMNTLVHYSLLVVGLSIGLRFVGVGLSSFALLAGVLGIGIGFGLRNVTENFISGLIVLVERPIQVGDWIDVDGEVEGQVRNIRARSTTLRTRDNISIIIPNSEFVGRQVTNWSHGDPKVRLQIAVGVVYGSDTDLVRRTLYEVAERHGRVLDKPAAEVQFRAFGASSLDFLLLVWIEEQHHRFRIESDLRFAIDAAFRRKGIVIAFPQLDVHLKSIDPELIRAFGGGHPEARSEVEPASPGTERREGRKPHRGALPAPIPEAPRSARPGRPASADPKRRR